MNFFDRTRGASRVVRSIMHYFTSKPAAPLLGSMWIASTELVVCFVKGPCITLSLEWLMLHSLLWILIISGICAIANPYLCCTQYLRQTLGWVNIYTVGFMDFAIVTQCSLAVVECLRVSHSMITAQNTKGIIFMFD